MYQFFVEASQIDIDDRSVRIIGKDVNHIRNVLRMKVGEELSVRSEQDNREYRCGIREFTEEYVDCELRFIQEDEVELSGEIYLFQGLPKADKMELIVQKAVELGVYQIIPMETKRCVMKLDEKKAKNKISRWQAIAEAAAKQSKRGIIPEVRQSISFAEAVRQAADMEMKLIPYEMAEGMDKTKQILAKVQAGQRIAVLIGPEGGFTKEEIALATAQGLEPITLGRRILRTETAGLTVISWLMYQLEQ